MFRHSKKGYYIHVNVHGDLHVYDSHIHVDMNSSTVFAGLNAAVFSEEKISQSLGAAYAPRQSKSGPLEP